MPDDDQPILPYGSGDRANSGHAGSDASRERAERDDSDGTTSRRQRLVVADLARHGIGGATYREVGSRLNLHHGQSSGVLSNLHKAGVIERLVEKRGRCHVYVLREFVNGRQTQPPGRVARPGLGPVADQMAQVLRDISQRGFATSSTVQRIDHLLAEYDRVVH